jgi:signal transduction histidine kinase
MNPASPNQLTEKAQKPAWDTLWPETIEPEVSSRTLHLALEAKYAQNQRLHYQMIRLVKSLPVAALLLTQNSRIVASNQYAQSLMTNIDWTKPRNRADELWGILGWPPVPFTHWEWEEGHLSCWEHPLGIPDQPSSLIIRYLRNDSFLQSADEEHRERLVAIGNMTGRLAHNIRNPLTSIEFFTTLLRRAKQGSQNFLELSQYLLQAIRSMKGLMTNLLMFSHPMPPQLEEVDLSSLLNAVKVLAAHLIKKNNLTIHCHQESGLQTVLADEALLTQALLNILLNAIHASQVGGQIEIKCWRDSIAETGMTTTASAEGLVFSIQDHGCGMSSEEVSKIFHPFYSNRKGGTGLGLAIAKQIVQLHQGMITIKSEQGKGTTVRLFLPQKRSRAC